MLGKWLAVESDDCTCFGGDAYSGHEPHCGVEPVADLDNDEINLSVLWDMSEIDSSLPLYGPPKALPFDAEICF